MLIEVKIFNEANNLKAINDFIYNFSTRNWQDPQEIDIHYKHQEFLKIFLRDPLLLSMKIKKNKFILNNFH